MKMRQKEEKERREREREGERERNDRLTHCFVLYDAFANFLIT